MEEAYDPVELYRTTLKDQCATAVSTLFEELFLKSGVDADQNAVTVQQLRVLDEQLSQADFSSRSWKVLRALGMLAVVGLGVAGYLQYQQTPQSPTMVLPWVGGAVAVLALILAVLNPLILERDGRVRKLKAERDGKEEEAWAQMAPLNRLYDWNHFAQLVHGLMPSVQLDPFVSAGRIEQMQAAYGWSDQFNHSRSILFSHSGLLNRQPFLLVHALKHWMGTETYTGSRTIYWTERFRDSNGRMQSVSRSETLYASVTKPLPVYANETVLIYGNQAAPNLSFSRTPTFLSGLGDGFVGDTLKSLAIKRLERKSRKMVDKGGFTIMSNQEFDALFGATDRDNEVQFRMLFTPLAQRGMVRLLEDSEVGFGDDFQFTKRSMLNWIQPGHVAKLDISADPAQFRACDLAHARTSFNEYYNALFKSFFFTLAPILVIPIYQQTDPPDCAPETHRYGVSSFWEHEAIANYLGEESFRSPESITRNLLQAHPVDSDDGSQRVEITAHGYKGIDRVDVVIVSGGDGRDHRVEVPWVEYLPVSQESCVVVHDSPGGTMNDGTDGETAEGVTNNTLSWQASLVRQGADPAAIIQRRSILAAVL